MIRPPGFVGGNTYCVRVRALSDDSFRENDNADSDVISQWTQVGGENQPAFKYQAPPASILGDPVLHLGAPDYLGPSPGEVVRTPLLRWQPKPGARSYYVLVSRDPNFQDVVDAAFTVMPAYAPNLALEDEETSYYLSLIHI